MNRTTKIILLVMIIVIVMLAVACCALLGGFFDRDQDTDKLPTILPPDYPPMETDENQEAVDGDATVPASSSGGSITISFTHDVLVDLSDKTISFTYANTQSNQNVVLRLSVQDVLLGESATITPGNKLTKMTLNDDAAERLQAGTYDGVFVVGFYNMETGEKSMVDTRLEVEVKVQE